MSLHPAQHFVIIAGEHSGDQLGGQLIKSLCQMSDFPIRFTGVGGPLMQQEGLSSLFAMEELSLMGFVEILPHIFALKRRIKQTVAHIIEKKPDIVITIDSPGFTFRVINQLKRLGYTGSKFVHYVAPTVWAYKPKRAAKTARLFDMLLTLFAFEPAYFTKEGLTTHWVGHEAAWKAAPVSMNMIDNQQLCVFAGSRRNELKRHLPIYRDIVKQLSARCAQLSVIMPLPASLHAFAVTLTKDWSCPISIIDSHERFSAMHTSRAGLIKSGTITLEAGLSGLAGVVIFKGNPISAWIVKHFIHSAVFGLPNIILKKSVMPEFIQYNIVPEHIADVLYPLLTNDSALAKQKEALQGLKHALLVNEIDSPSTLAARQILQCVHTARSEATSSS